MVGGILTGCNSTDAYGKLFEELHQLVRERLTDLPDKVLQVCAAAIVGLKEVLVLTTILYFAEASGNV